MRRQVRLDDTNEGPQD